MELIRAFAFKVKHNLSEEVFDELPVAFPSVDLPSLHQVKSRVAFLSGFNATAYDCCLNSCVCYTGPYKDLQKCPKCDEPRFKANGRPRQRFQYIPIIPRLQKMMANRKAAESMKYRGYDHPKWKEENNDQTSDIFDGAHYQGLLGKHVDVDGNLQSHTFFSDPRDIALGFGTDGFSPYDHRKATTWPLFIFNYNLPPDIRFHKENVMCIGVIPGPKKPWDCDSFLYPAIEELVRLELGVKSYDSLSKDIFLMRAYLIILFGDIPAVSMIMRMKGHNGLCPCRLCNILGIRVPDSRAPVHYVPLNRSSHPNPTPIKEYDPSRLPLRTSEEFMSQAHAVQFAATSTLSKNLATKYGIKGIPVLSSLSLLSFPKSSGFEFMHLALENIIPNLVLFWAGEFKGLDAHQPYVIPATAWSAIGLAAASSRSTIPSAFGAAVPNIAVDRSTMSAETWSIWALFLAPILLRDRFTNPVYYEHFCDIVILFNICLQFEITKAEIQVIRDGFIKWVKDYERFVTRTCVNCFHLRNMRQTVLSK
jgi:hypothetical protein